MGEIEDSLSYPIFFILKSDFHGYVAQIKLQLFCLSKTKLYFNAYAISL